MEEKLLQAPEGQVYTSYKGGDTQIVYGKAISYRSPEPPAGWYLMEEAEAQRIEAEFAAKREAEEAAMREAMEAVEEGEE